MRLNVAIPEDHVRKPILDAALEGVTRLDHQLIDRGEAPLFRDAVNRVRWQPEPPGQEHFDHAGIVLGRGWGDCDDLAPWHAASLRATGEDRGAKAVVRRSGPSRWHAVVKRSDGSIDDPSREAGMGHTTGAVLGIPPMFEHGSSVSGTYMQRPALAMRPVLDRMGQPEAWQSRLDLPWHWQPGKSPADVAMVSLHESPVASQSLVGAVDNALRWADASDMVDGEVIDRAAAIRDMAEGCGWEEVAYRYGPEHADAAAQVVGSFFGSIAHAFKKAVPAIVHVAKYVAPATAVIPGVGPIIAPLATAGLAAADAALHHRKVDAGKLANAALSSASATFGHGGGGNVQHMLDLAQRALAAGKIARRHGHHKVNPRALRDLKRFVNRHRPAHPTRATWPPTPGTPGAVKFRCVPVR